jgi:phospholipid/cholesterol/gamma-HCH transport system substrate-binding protein
MHTTHASPATRFKVGIFTILGLALIGAITVFVNDRPFWWRPCELVHISVEDATGLKTKSPVRSLGLQIGYLRSVELSETHVRLGICITAPVEVLPATRAYIRGEGFLGDKFVELKPVKYTGGDRESRPAASPKTSALRRLFALLIPEARAESTPAKKDGREIPVGEKSQDVQQLVNQVDSLVEEMTTLTNNLKEAIDPREMRATLNQLNKTLENASRTLSPEGGLNTTAQRTLAKLEDAIEQLRDMMTRVNKGEGSVGMLLNDPTYAEEIREAVRNVNRLLSRVGGVRFVIDVGAQQIPILDGGRGWFRLGIFPQPDRYYLLGITLDPRGKRNVTTTTTVINGGTPQVVTTTEVDQGGILITGMLGKVFWRRLDLSLGVLHGDGTLSTALNLGPRDREELLILRDDLYSRGQGLGIDNRVTATLRPFLRRGVFGNVFLQGGLETTRKINGKLPWLYGAGVSFDDDDIKILFALR